LAEHTPFDGPGLASALRATFERRGTPIPSRVPLALTPDFAASSEKQAQWAGFLKKNRLSSTPKDLGQVVERLARFLGPVIDAARRESNADRAWPPGGPWRPGQAPRAD
ncbi:MAG: nucleotidyl transferase AbiEii/AbiGii toxin family protein, partial [Candidatus Rokubacteria bacterium]|nr:nucleotidyl transferase AbiEii/AbiGii toxin family protein [Candidatus Rokubacteria bacterium]